MEDILTIPIDRPQTHPLRLCMMIGLTVLLYLMISVQVVSATGGATVLGG